MSRITTGVLLGAAAFMQLANAQTTPGACSVPGLSVSALNIERRLALTNFLLPAAVTLPASLVTALQAGAIEGRERVVFNTTANTLTSTLFVTQPSTALPIPQGVFAALGPTEVVAVTTLQVDRIYCTTRPANAIMVVGTIASNDIRGPFPNTVGTPAAIAFTFTNDSPPKLANVATLVAGQGVTLTADAVGTLTVSGFAPAGGAGGATGPTADAGPAKLQVVTRVFVLDGSKSDPGPNGPITYKWAMAKGGKTAAIAQGSTAKPNVDFAEGFGDYIFELTVTDSKGATSTDTITISYVP